MQVFILEDMSGTDIANLGRCVFFSEENKGVEVIGVYKWHSSYGYVVVDDYDDSYHYKLCEFTKAIPIRELYRK